VHGKYVNITLTVFLQNEAKSAGDGIARCCTFIEHYGALLEDNLHEMAVTLFSNQRDFHIDGY
jgi:hypothetical protein